MHTGHCFEDSFFSETRRLFAREIAVLVKNGCSNAEKSWSNIFVKKEKNAFCPELIHHTEFSGTIVLGAVRPGVLKYHDLELECGIYNSRLENCIIEDDVCIRNVAYLSNYRIGSRVILFNIQEMSCTRHSKFGNGILKKGETEDIRICLGVANENNMRAVLPFENMICADAYIWSRYREDTELMKRFVELTEYGNDKEKPTYGIVYGNTVIKNTVLIKDAKIGSHAYIKGAFKLKNITICSSEAEPSQIGEGTEMVNGIMGYGSKVFYQAVAVRFVIGKNCQLKYGARLLNSVLGDNSTVSCCELLNNLIFPFHEQHHNTSFLIAATVLGQSNIAAGATIGSNHNSRSPDGEIIAGRGFWPGLCSDFKHNSKFASFTLISKGSYQNELNIRYPFSLVSIDSTEQAVHIIPAYWFLHNMYAIMRSSIKFKERDKRVVKVQHIETDPLAPDTMQEVLAALDRIIELTGRTLKLASYQDAKDFLHRHKDASLVLEDFQAQKRFGAKVFKAVQAYREYRKIVKYFAARTVLTFCEAKNFPAFNACTIEEIKKTPLYTDWVNAGGQIMPEAKLYELFDFIKRGKINTWDEVHEFYNSCQNSYILYAARYALFLLEYLYTRSAADFTADIYADICSDVITVSDSIYEGALSSRKKDFTDFFRTMTYRNKEEMTAVLGEAEHNSFLRRIKADTCEFKQKISLLFKDAF
ncbi:DUF4954 family protein [Treponema sp. OMZ 840]